MVEASVVKASFLLAAESTMGGGGGGGGGKNSGGVVFLGGSLQGRRCGWSEEWAHLMTLCCSSLPG